MFLSPFGRTIASRTFVLLISLSATCFAFASGLANILASNLSEVSDNARVMGCTCANSPSNYSSTMLDGVPSRVSRLLTPLYLLSSIPQETSMSIIPNVIRVFSPPATCLVFASGLANILASNLSGVPDNARGVMGCS